MTTTLTPAQMAKQADLSVDTLRYYEKAGLMPRVHRLPNGHRRYSASDIEWLDLVKCLRVTGMPIRHIQRYAELNAAGEETARDRFDLLREHKEAVLQQIAELRRNLEHLDWKLEYYHDAFGFEEGSTT
jgi:DNA-binding transcriptional MerR regulator